LKLSLFYVFVLLAYFIFFFFFHFTPKWLVVETGEGALGWEKLALASLNQLFSEQSAANAERAVRNLKKIRAESEAAAAAAAEVD
jgi:hypothetical protein